MPGLPSKRSPASGVRHELALAASVLGTAGVFALLFTFLPGIGATSPEEDAASAIFEQAAAAEKKDPDKALELYATVPSEARAWHERALREIARLKVEAARRPPKPSAAERADHEALAEFWRRNAGNYEDLIRKGEEFVMAHPRGELRPDVEERIAHARQGRATQRAQEADAVEAAVERALQRRDYAGAIQAIEKVSDRLRPELDVWPRLAARRDAVVVEARKHYERQIEEADRLVKEGMRDDARRLWYTTLRSFGEGQVPELADLHRASMLRSEEIRP